MSDVTSITAEALAALLGQSSTSSNQELNLESFGYFLSDYVIEGAVLTLDALNPHKLTISESIIAFASGLYRVQPKTVQVQDKNKTYFIDFTVKNGFEVTESGHPNTAYLPLWQMNTDGTGNIISSVDLRGEMGFLRFRSEIQGIITGSVIVDENRITDNAISTNKLQAESVTEGKIAPGAVSETKLKMESVTEGKVAPGAISTSKLQTESVTESKIAPGAVTETKIANDQVPHAKIKGKVSESKLQLDYPSGGLAQRVSQLEQSPAGIPEVTAARGGYASLSERLAAIDIGLALNSQTFTATTGQTVFTLTSGSYVPGTKRMSVYITGAFQKSGTNYTETSSTTITLSEGVDAGSQVDLVWYEGKIPVTSGHGKAHKLGGYDELNIADLAGFASMDSRVNTNTTNTTTNANSITAIKADYVNQIGKSTSSFSRNSPETDDTGKFQRALDYANANGVNLLIDESLTINGSISAALTKDINIIAKKGTIIDGTGSTSDTLITVGGSRGASTALISDVSKGSMTIGANLTGLVAGDILLVTSTDLFNPVRAYYYKGEMVEVDSVSGTTITLKSQLYDTYTAATTSVIKLNTPRVSIVGLTIKRNSNHKGLFVQLAKDVLISDCEISGARERGFYTEYIYGGVFERLRAYDCWYSGTGTSYGLMISTSQNIWVKHGIFVGGRHGVTTGGFEPNRNIRISNNVIDNYHSSGASALDFHGNIEHSVMEDNFVINGISITGKNLKIANNDIYSPVQPGIDLQCECNADYILIEGNTIDVLTNYGINYGPTQSNVATTLMRIKGNTIRGGTSALYGIRVAPRSISITGCTISRLELQDNDVVTQSNANYSLGILDASGVFVSITTLKIYGGHYESAAFHSAYLSNSSGVGDVKIDNASFVTGSTGNYGLRVINFATLSMIKTKTSATVTAYRNEFGAAFVKIKDCVFKNFTDSKGLYLQSAVGDAVVSDNRFEGCTGSIAAASTATRLIDRVSTNGQVIAYGTAAPTTGTWTVGDRVINQAPAVGSPKSWVCTGAGTPGTWVSEGNL